MSAISPAVTSPERKAGWREALVVLALFALALGLRLYDLTGESLWYDETYSVWTAVMDIGSPRVLWEMKVEFPAYYWFLHIWVRLFGASDLSVRLVGAILGALTVLPVYALGRRLFDRPTGAVAALLLAVNPYHIWYSQEVRMHAWATLFVALSLVAFWRLLRGGRWPWWLAHLLVTALTFYVQSYVVFLIVAENLFMVGYLWSRHGSPFSRAGWHTLRWWLLEQALLLGLMVPGIVILLVKMLTLRQWDWLAGAYGRPGLHQISGLLADWLLGTNYPGSRAMTWGALLLAVALAVYGLLRRGWRERAASAAEARASLALPVVLLGVSLVLVFVGGQFAALWVTRYMLPFLPLLLLLVALGIRELPRWLGWAPLVALLLVSAVALQTMYATQQKEDWRGLAEHLAPRVAARDLIVLMDDECRVPFNHYYGDGGRRLGISRFAEDAALEAAVANIARMNQGGRLWLVVSHAESAALEARLAALPWLAAGERSDLVGIRLIEYDMLRTGSN